MNPGGLVARTTTGDWGEERKQRMSCPLGLCFRITSKARVEKYAAIIASTTIFYKATIGAETNPRLSN